MTDLVNADGADGDLARVDRPAAHPPPPIGGHVVGAHLAGLNLALALATVPPPTFKMLAGLDRSPSGVSHFLAFR